MRKKIVDDKKDKSPAESITSPQFPGETRLENHIIPCGDHFTPLSKDIFPLSNRFTPLSEDISPLSLHSTPLSKNISPLSNHFTPLSDDCSPAPNHRRKVKYLCREVKSHCLAGNCHFLKRYDARREERIPSDRDNMNSSKALTRAFINIKNA